MGPRQDVREVRADTRILVAHRLRLQNVDPASVNVTDVIVVKNSAVVRWNAGGLPDALMGLIRIGARWWDAVDAGTALCSELEASYPLQSARVMEGRNDARALTAHGMPTDIIVPAEQNGILPSAGPEVGCPVSHWSSTLNSDAPVEVFSTGSRLAPQRSTTGGYGIDIQYAKNDAAARSVFEPIYARAPTEAEVLPCPLPMDFSANAVSYFDLTVSGPAPVHFNAGTTIDVWVPWVLDNTLYYDLTIGFAQPFIGPVFAKPVDNVLHFTLPAFTALPDRAMMAEIDGNKHKQ